MFKLVTLVCITSIILQKFNCTEQDIVVSDWRLVFTCKHFVKLEANKR